MNDSYHVIEMHPELGHHELSSHDSLDEAVKAARHTVTQFPRPQYERFIIQAKNDENSEGEAYTTYDSEGNHAPHYMKHIER